MCYMSKKWIYIPPTQTSNHETQIILLIIAIREGWRYNAVKEISALLIILTSKNDAIFMVLIVLIRSVQKQTHKNHKKTNKKGCESKYFRVGIMPSENTEILKFNQYLISDQTTSIIHVDLASFEKWFTTKVGENILSRYLFSTIWTFDGIENKYNIYSGEDFM